MNFQTVSTQSYFLETEGFVEAEVFSDTEYLLFYEIDQIIGLKSFKKHSRYKIWDNKGNFL